MTSNYIIDTSRLPQPVPIWGPLTGFNDQFFGKVLQERIDRHSEILKRPPNQEEVEAISFWVAKQISIYSYATPVGLLTGVWAARSTSATYRFPFWQPNLEKFNPQTFPSPRMPLVRGNNAVFLWHALRYAVYGGAARAASQILFGSYSMTVSAVGEIGDQRLKAVMEAAKQDINQKRKGLPAAKLPGTTGSPQNGPGGGRSVDDTSPTGGMFLEETAGFGGNPPGTNDDPRTETQPESKPWPQQSGPTPVRSQRTETQDESFDPFKQSYPSSGLDARADVSPPQVQRQQGSAWDRVRQTAGRGSNGRQSEPSYESGQPREQQRGWAWVREQAQSPTLASNDYAFSQGDEDRSMAKGEAQKEFDARVERERRGGDFTSDSGDQKRW